MNRISQRIVSWLISNKTILPSEEAVYRYAAYNVLYAAIPVLLVVLIGVFLNVVPGAILFAITFIALRKYTGGFHFQKIYACLVFSTVTEFEFIYLAAECEEVWIMAVLLICGCCSLIVNSPIYSSKRKLSEMDIIRCKMMTKRVLTGVMLVWILLCITGFPWLAAYPTSAVVMTAMFQYPAIIENKRRNKEC